MRPRLLDLFCGAGDAAMGYYRAGFDIVGVDIKPQPHYPFEFHQGDALEFCATHGREFDAIHASPPCQGYSRMRHLPWLTGREYPMLIPETRKLLQETGKTYIIENVRKGHYVMVITTNIDPKDKKKTLLGLDQLLKIANVVDQPL